MIILQRKDRRLNSQPEPYTETSNFFPMKILRRIWNIKFSQFIGSSL